MPSAFLPSSFALFCLLYVIFFLHLIPFFCFYISLAMYSLISFAQSFRLSFVPFLRIPFLQLQASPPYTSQPIQQPISFLQYSQRYRAKLQAGRSGDRIPVRARFSAAVQTGPGAHPAPYTMGTGSLSQG